MEKSNIMIFVSLFYVLFSAFILPKYEGYKKQIPVFILFTLLAFIAGVSASNINYVFYSFLILYTIATLPAILWGFGSRVNSMRLSKYIFYMFYITVMGSECGLVMRMELHKLLPDLVPKIIS